MSGCLEWPDIHRRACVLEGNMRDSELIIFQKDGYMKLTIGEKIAVLRKEKNISQTELAEYLFLAQQTVSQ